MTRHAWMALGLSAAGLAAMSCGGSSNSGSGNTPGGFTITISGLRYSPLDLRVPPGATITVVNNDGMPHSVTSEATSGSFTPGAVAGIQFDTGDFSSGSKTISIPSSAAAGTVVPYYCTYHKAAMATPNGTITIDPSATAP